jgi:hypothetical protein
MSFPFLSYEMLIAVVSFIVESTNIVFVAVTPGQVWISLNSFSKASVFFTKTFNKWEPSPSTE